MQTSTLITDIAPEIESTFRKSSFSESGTPQCIEVADAAVGSYMRDTTQRELGALLFTSGAFSAFTATAAKSA